MPYTSLYGGHAMDIPILTLKPEDKSSQVSYLKQFSVTETFRLHTHDFYELFYICKGKSLHEINSSTQLLTKGALVFIRPKDVHKFDFFNNYDFLRRGRNSDRIRFPVFGNG